MHIEATKCVIHKTCILYLTEDKLRNEMIANEFSQETEYRVTSAHAVGSQKLEMVKIWVPEEKGWEPLG